MIGALVTFSMSVCSPGSLPAPLPLFLLPCLPPCTPASLPELMEEGSAGTLPTSTGRCTDAQRHFTLIYFPLPLMAKHANHWINS